MRVWVRVGEGVGEGGCLYAARMFVTCLSRHALVGSRIDTSKFGMTFYHLIQAGAAWWEADGW